VRGWPGSAWVPAAPSDVVGDGALDVEGRGEAGVGGEAGDVYRHHACGEISHVDLRCAHCGEPMHAGDVDLLPGPGAAT
jgi:hypothetical protein